MIIFQQAAEIFPTDLRNQSMSIGNSVKKIFAISVPYISALGHHNLLIPLMIFGSFSLIAAVLLSFLPETLNVPLPQSIEEVEQQGSDQKYFSFDKKS